MVDIGSRHQIAVAFRTTGRHTGPLLTSAGVLPPTGQEISLLSIDILTLDRSRITAVTVVVDELRALHAIDAAHLDLTVNQPRIDVADRARMAWEALD